MPTLYFCRPLESAQEPQAPQNDANPTVEDEDADVEEVEDEEQEDSIMVPQVKVAEDGSLIIDEERSVGNCAIIVNTFVLVLQ